jgi:hypothetical protein
MEVSGELHALAALSPGKEPLITFGYEAGWAPEPAWTLWSREKYLVSAGKLTPAFQPVPILTELSLLTKFIVPW